MSLGVQYRYQRPMSIKKINPIFALLEPIFPVFNISIFPILIFQCHFPLFPIIFSTSIFQCQIPIPMPISECTFQCFQFHIPMLPIQFSNVSNFIFKKIQFHIMSGFQFHFAMFPTPSFNVSHSIFQ